MKRTLLLHLLLLVALTATEALAAEEAAEFNTTLIRSTFKLAGKNAIGKVSTGTVFILAKPSAADPKTAHYVLVTAAHVLDNVVDDEAVLFLR